MKAVILTSHEGFCGIEASVRKLKAGASALDAIEHGIQLVEDDHRARTVGYGGAPNILGQMECDASIMDGRELRVGCAGALRRNKHPISVARKIMEILPHVFLSGEGADRFGLEQGLDEADLLSEIAKNDWQEWLKNNLSPAELQKLPQIPLTKFISFGTRSDLSKGTVTFIARDAHGNMGGGVSTSGWAYKYPGRLGDSPVIGAGLYVDNRFGGVACTHTGEMTIRASTARSVILYMKHGASVISACHEAIEDLWALKGGYLGPVIIHAMDKDGQVYVVSTGGNDGDSFWTWETGQESAVEGEPEVQKVAS